MAQAHREEKIQEDPEDPETKVKERDGVPFKFNAQAPEFIPRSQTQMPISGYFYPCLHLLGGTTSGPDWIYVGDHEPPTYFLSNPSNAQQSNSSKNVLSDDLQLKIIKQVEYQFSDMSLLANESLMKHISRDPEGYVPVSVIASTKKIKSLTNNHQMLVQALRSSLKLVVSNDGKKVRRKHPFTEKDKEELHSRIVVAENLPEDHSHQNLERIFSVVGSVKTIRVCHGDSVKTIRVCHPHESNSSRSKSDFFISNKLHALVEYETTDLADKAVEKLNDERNWRKGLRVRLLLRCSPKSVLKTRKSEFDGVLDDGETPVPGSPEDASQPSNIESVGESNAEENLVGPKKGWARGRGKARGRSQNHNGRGLLAPSPQLNSVNQCEASAKQSCKGPRMPDGTRGFTMGRGKPLTTPTLLATSPME